MSVECPKCGERLTIREVDSICPECGLIVTGKTLPEMCVTLPPYPKEFSDA